MGGNCVPVRPQTLRQRRLVDKGLCRDCGSQPVCLRSKSRCGECLRKNRERYRGQIYERRKRLLSAGLCRSCGKQPLMTRALCETCRSRSSKPRQPRRTGQTMTELYRARKASGLCPVCGLSEHGARSLCGNCRKRAAEKTWRQYVKERFGDDPQLLDMLSAVRDLGRYLRKE